jgi:hypothetical protein
MATQPQFSPDQDMSNVSPEDVAEAKERAKATEAYNEVSKLAPAPKPAPKPEKPKAQPKKMAKGGKVSSASKRADGIAQRGKTRGRFV